MMSDATSDATREVTGDVTGGPARWRWCPCRVGLAFSLLAVVGAFLAHAAVDALAMSGWVALMVGVPVGMVLCLRGCGTAGEEDLTDRTVAHTGVALSVLSLVVFVV